MYRRERDQKQSRIAATDMSLLRSSQGRQHDSFTRPDGRAYVLTTRYAGLGSSSFIDLAADRNPPFHSFFVNFFAAGVVILSKDTQKEIDFFHCERNVIMIGLLFDEE